MPGGRSPQPNEKASFPMNLSRILCPPVRARKPVPFLALAVRLGPFTFLLAIGGAP